MAQIINRTGETPSFSPRTGGIAALLLAATFIVGIALFATLLTDYTTGDPTPAESVRFLVEHQAALHVWHGVTLIVFGIALVPLALCLHDLLRGPSPALARTATAFALIWAGLVLATGMIANVGTTAISDLAAGSPDQAAALWSAVDTIQNGLGGGNEIVGGVWVLLVSWAGLRAGVLPRGLHVLGAVGALAGLVTVVPGFEAAELGFGLVLIVWFAWLGGALLREARPAVAHRDGSLRIDGMRHAPVSAASRGT